LRRHAPGRGEPEEHLLQGLAAASRHDPAAAAEDLGLALQGAGPHAPGRPEVIELWRADAEFAAGLWDDAERHAREVAALAPADDPLGAAAPAHALLARLHAARAAWWQAEGHLRLAAERRVPSTGRAWLDLALAELAWLQGRPQEALAALGEAREADASGEALVLRADVLLRLGGPAEADAAVARVEALAAQATPSSWLALAAARLRGELEAAQENEGAALAVLTTGMLRRQTHPLASAHLEEAYGRLLRRVGRPGAAAAALQAARERLAQVGATAYLAGVERELRACGVPPSGWALERPKLSPREHEVALLAAAGYTNRDIAQRLHLSVKAVEYHITRVLAKLGAGSRRELPGLLPRARTPAGGGLPSLLQREE
jgi:DNA-binding CsgD family transcriptional regulator